MPEIAYRHVPEPEIALPLGAIDRRSSLVTAGDGKSGIAATASSVLG